MVPVLDCTVVVCTRNRPLQLTRCLESLLLQTHAPAEILVVDSAPVDTTNQELAERFGARLVVEPLPGLSRARNTGIRNCTRSVIAFLDDDCIAHPDWLQFLLAEFSEASVMAVTGNILMPGPEFGTARFTLTPAHPDWFEIANFGGVGSGGNMAFRRTVGPALFDERLGRGVLLPACEENYAFYSVVQGGHSIAYTPHSVVRHPRKTGTAAFRANFRDAACSVAYFTLLLVETPYRLRVVKYCLGALAGRRRSWRQPANGQPIGRRWWTPLAVLAGPLLYLVIALQMKAEAQPLRALELTAAGREPE